MTKQTPGRRATGGGAGGGVRLRAVRHAMPQLYKYTCSRTHICARPTLALHSFWNLSPNSERPPCLLRPSCITLLASRPSARRLREGACVRFVDVSCCIRNSHKRGMWSGKASACSSMSMWMADSCAMTFLRCVKLCTGWRRFAGAAFVAAHWTLSLAVAVQRCFEPLP